MRWRETSCFPSIPRLTMALRKLGQGRSAELISSLWTLWPRLDYILLWKGWEESIWWPNLKVQFVYKVIWQLQTHFDVPNIEKYSRKDSQPILELCATCPCPFSKHPKYWESETSHFFKGHPYPIFQVRSVLVHSCPDLQLSLDLRGAPRWHLHA